MGRAGARGAMRELADQMQGPSEREHTMMAMVTNGQRTAARPAPWILDCQCDACELRVFWPAIRHEGPLLVQDRLGNQHTIYRPMCVLAFYRIVVKKAMRLLCQVIEHTGDLTLLTYGERRYRGLVFELCSQALRTGKRGRPKKTLPKGVKVRLKNKGSQRHKRGPKRPKYQAPYPEHPDTAQPVATTDIHANHLEAFHTSLRRRCAAYRRRTNMYAKKTGRLQERLDVYWIVHNFVRVHFTTRQVPAVALGILDHGFALHEIFMIQKAA